MATDDLETGFRVEQVTPPNASQPIQVVTIEESRLVDGPVLHALEIRLAALHSADPRLDLLIDLGLVDFMTSPALGLLGMQHRKVWNTHGRMKVCSVRPPVMEVLRITHLLDHFDLHSTRAEAIASF